MTNSTRIYNMDGDDLQKYLTGRSIVSISDVKDTPTITLDNGVVLELEPASECCAWYEADMSAFDFEDNVITGVTETSTETDSDNIETFTLQVFSAHKTIAQVNITGDPGSGYYCHSITLVVKTPTEVGE